MILQIISECYQLIKSSSYLSGVSGIFLINSNNFLFFYYFFELIIEQLTDTKMKKCQMEGADVALSLSIIGTCALLTQAWSKVYGKIETFPGYFCV